MGLQATRDSNYSALARTVFKRDTNNYDNIIEFIGHSRSFSDIVIFGFSFDTLRP